MSKDVFISHSSHDGGIASAVCAGLEARGLRCWIAPRDIQSGQSWGASIVQALDGCPVMVLVLTAQANTSRHVVREVERADGKQARIITFRVEDVVLNPSLEYFLSADHWFDALSRPLQAHLPALAEAVQGLRGLARGAGKPAALALSAAAKPATLSEHELVQSFDQLAPDDWNHAPRGKLGRFIRGLFDDS
jgi:hypothetical protein